tara:strand:+ start:673 stop:834 length:162 start_codon:yes stop_codon:yes gene_type:complete
MSKHFNLKAFKEIIFRYNNTKCPNFAIISIVEIEQLMVNAMDNLYDVKNIKMI